MLALFQGCNKDEMDEAGPAASISADDNLPAARQDVLKTLIQDNPRVDPKSLPPFTMIPNDYAYTGKSGALRSPECLEALSPSLIEATLRSGEFVETAMTACLEGAPPKGDILFCMDLTGSMGDALNAVKTNSIDIMDAVRALIGDSDFGLISHMDYPGYYSYCGYSATYGDAAEGDYPYMLNHRITDDCAAVAASINLLELGYGWDSPECYGRVFFETYSDPNIEWREGAAKIVVAFLDMYPHDCDLSETYFPDGTGGDPGRDGIMGTGDDIDFDAVIPAMAANNIKLIVIDSYGGVTGYWEPYASSTGGTAVELGDDVVTQIVELVEAAVVEIASLSIVPDAPYASWVEVEPAFVGPVTLDEEQEFPFDVTITVPPGTPDGLYEFDLHLVGDGAEYGTSHVVITVQNVIEVGVDIKPGSCPNPLNTKAAGIIPVAICGTADFDVSNIDVSTIRLAGVAPEWSNMGDAATPYEPFVDKPLDIYSCNTLGPDGYMDLKFKFDNFSVIQAIKPVKKGDVKRIILTGELYDGTPIIGEDIVKIAN